MQNERDLPPSGGQTTREETDLSKQWYQDLAEGIDHEIIWQADDGLHFSAVSKRAEQLLGYSVEQWRREPDFWRSHLHPEDRDQVLSTFRNASNGEDQTCNHRFIAADGRVVWFLTGVHAIVAEGKTAYHGFSVDITHLKATEETLKQKTKDAEEANRNKSYLLSVASHEMRNVLSAIVGYADLLKNGRVSEEKRNDIYHHIYRNSTALLEFVSSILDADKTGREPLNLHAQLSEISLPQMLRQVLEDLKFLWEEKGLKTELIEDPTVPLIRSDSGKLFQIFTNVMMNAVKFTERGAITVRIRNHIEERKVSVEIQDTGIGIPEQSLPRLFEPFYQTDPSSAGRGLGLSIVKELAALLKGTVDLKSRPGIGSTATLCFPYEVKR